MSVALGNRPRVRAEVSLALLVRRTDGLDGRGALSLEALKEFGGFFLGACSDRITNFCEDQQKADPFFYEVYRLKPIPSRLDDACA